MAKNKLKALFFIGLFIISFVGSGFINIITDQSPVRAATNYYVSSSGGNDANAGTSEGAPWQNLSKVNDEMNGGVINDGDNVYFKRGDTFTDHALNSLMNGTSRSDPLVLGAYGTGTDPIISGISTPIRPWYGGYYSVAVSNITIQNIRFENNSGNHINFGENASDIIIENCFFGNRTGSIAMGMVRLHNNAHDCIIRNCTFDWFKTDAYEDGVSLCGVYNILVENNTFKGITHTCVMVYGYWAPYTGGYITSEVPAWAHPYENVIVRNNIMNTPRRGSEPGYWAQYTLFENNTINIWPYCNDPSNASYQILGGSEQMFLADYTIHRFETLIGVRDSRATSVYGSGDAAPTNHVALYHNTIYSTDRLHVPADYRYPGSSGYSTQGIVQAHLSGGIYNYSVFNNIIYCSHPDNYLIASWYDGSATYDFQNCLFENNICRVGDSFVDQKLRINGINRDLSYCEANSPISNITFDNNLAEIPEMSTTNFTLNLSSNCVDAGRHLTTTTTGSTTSAYIGVNEEWHLWPRVTIMGTVYPGDIIFVGNDQNLEVLAVYTTNHTIKVNRSIYHLVGQSVGFQIFYSDLPDLGDNQRANELFIATTGSDTTGDGSIDNPYATLWKAFNMSKAGDYIWMRGGVYTPATNMRIKNMLFTDWVTVSSYPGEWAIIQGDNCPIGDRSVNASIQLMNCSYIRLTNFEVNHSRVGGVSVNYSVSGTAYSKYIMIDNLTIGNCSGFAIKVRYGHHIDVYDNYIYNNFNIWYSTTYSQETISYSKVNHSSIARNYLYKNHCEQIDAKGGCSWINIYENRINNSASKVLKTTGAYYAGGVGIYVDSITAVQHNISVYNNMIWGNNTAIQITNEAYPANTGHFENISVYNNVINITNESGGGCIGLIPGSRIGIAIMRGDSLDDPTELNKDISVYMNSVNMGDNNVYPPMQVGIGATPMNKEYIKRLNISNNIFTSHNRTSTAPRSYYLCSIYGLNSTEVNTVDEYLLMCDNLFNNSYPAALPRIGFTDGDWTQFTGPTKWGNNPIFVPPEYVDRAAGDLHLNATSPCINNATSSLVVAFDYDYTYRPQGGGYEIGAYEYYPTSPPNPNLVETTKIIYHGLSITPNIVEITPSSYPSSFFAYYVTDINATAFTIHLISNPEVTVSFYWRAKYV